MSDFFPVTPGAGRNFAVDKDLVLPDGTTADVERVKIGTGKEGVYVGDVSGTVKDGDTTDKPVALWTEDRPDCLQVSPTVTLVFSATPTSWVSGDNIGGVLTVANAAKAAGSGVRVDSITITDHVKATTYVDVLFFRDSITAPVDHSPFNPSNTDAAKVRGYVKIVASDWSLFSANGIAVRSDLNLIIPSLVATSLYVVLVARATTPYTANDNLTLTLGLTRL